MSSTSQDQPTGSFGIGAGYAVGNDGGIILEASIEEKNFLGRGQYIRVAAGGGTEGSRSYNISFTEPYFLGYRLAAGFDIFKNQTASSNDYYDYSEQGGSLRVTAPITEDLATTFRYNYKRLDYSGTGDWQNNLSAPYLNLIENGPWTQSSISQTFTYNTLDDQNLPREGMLAKLTHEIAGLGGDSRLLQDQWQGSLLPHDFRRAGHHRLADGWRRLRSADERRQAERLRPVHDRRPRNPWLRECRHRPAHDELRRSDGWHDLFHRFG